MCNNEKRKEEVKDESVWSEVEKIRKRVETSEKETVEGPAQRWRGRSFRLLLQLAFRGKARIDAALF
jgi:hypothetical protein